MPLLEYLWRKIAEARVQALPIVIDFDVFKHMVLGRLSGDKAFAVDGFDLEARAYLDTHPNHYQIIAYNKLILIR